MYDSFDEDLLPNNAVADEPSSDTPANSSSSGENDVPATDGSSSSAEEAVLVCDPTFKDSRDNQEYSLVKIGKQCWFGKNLNYASSVGSACYGDDEANCKTYGRMYDYETALAACPEGTHLPSAEEWEELINYAGGTSTAGKNLKADDQSGWDGENTVKFSALPGGKYGSKNNTLGELGLWWSSSETDMSQSKSYQMRLGASNAFQTNLDKESFISVRCLKSQN